MTSSDRILSPALRSKLMSAEAAAAIGITLDDDGTPLAPENMGADTLATLEAEADAPAFQIGRAHV